MELNVPLPVIGVARTGYRDPEATPIQAGLNRAGRGSIEIAERYRPGLDGLAGFDYAWLLSWLGTPGGEPPPLRQVPFLLRREQRAVGIFASRAPRRPAPIGLSLIRLLELTETGIVFAGVDLVDGTPVIDLKPYVTRFDRPGGEPRCGWFDQVTMGEGSTPGQLGPPGRG